MKPVLQIAKSATLLSDTDKTLRNLRKQFEEKHTLRLPGFLDPKLLKEIQEAVRKADFFEKTHSKIAKESCMEQNPTLALTYLLLNDEKLFDGIRKITGCATIGCFTGRLFRMVPGSDHYDSWHDDVTENRMIALSVNLSTTVYKGGNLQIRDKKSKKIIYDAANTGPGDAVLFRVAPFLEHQVGKITGRVTRITYAGWFRSEPKFLDLLKKRSKISSATI